MDQILALPDVEQADSEQKFYFNNGNVEMIKKLQHILKSNNVETTIVCCYHTGTGSIYYTPKLATMGPNGTWISNSVFETK